MECPCENCISYAICKSYGPSIGYSIKQKTCEDFDKYLHGSSDKTKFIKRYRKILELFDIIEDHPAEINK